MYRLSDNVGYGMGMRRCDAEINGVRKRWGIQLLCVVCMVCAMCDVCMVGYDSGDGMGWGWDGR